MLGQRRRRWANIESTLSQILVFSATKWLLIYNVYWVSIEFRDTGAMEVIIHYPWI